MEGVVVDEVGVGEEVDVVGFCYIALGEHCFDEFGEEILLGGEGGRAWGALRETG